MGKINCLHCNKDAFLNQDICPVCGFVFPKEIIPFLQYIGASDNLNGYQRSYKLVLLKALFEELYVCSDLGVEKITNKFRDFYISRKNQNLEADIDVDDRIKDIENSSLRDVFSVIKSNPLKAMSSHGFLQLSYSGNTREFVFPQYVYELKPHEIASIIRLLDKKIKLYYESVETETDVKETPSGSSNAEITVTGISLESLELSRRSYNAVRRAGISTFSQLLDAVNSKELEQIRNIGANSVREILNVVERYTNPTYEQIQCDSMALIEEQFSEGIFIRFCNICKAKGLKYVHELEDFDFDKLLDEPGFGIGKVNRIKNKFTYLTGCELTVNKAPEKLCVNEKNGDVTVGNLRFFGVTSHTINLLNEAGILLLKDFSNLDIHQLIKIVGKDKADSVINAVKKFEEPIIKIAEEILISCSKEVSFEIFILRSSGMSLREIGEKYNLTRERVRQICEGFQRKIVHIMLAVAEILENSNNSKYFTNQQLLDVFDEDTFDQVIVFALKNSKRYQYLDFAEIFVNCYEFPDIEEDLSALAREIVGEGINFFEKIQEIEAALSETQYNFITAEHFLNLLIKNNYKFYGDYVVECSKSYGLLCAQLVAEHFPDGIKNEENDIEKLRNLCLATYGNIEIPANNRSFMTRVVCYLVQRGRSVYISPKNITIDMNVLNEIKNYIDNCKQQDIYYSEIFSEFEGMLLMTSNIDNPGFLHGVLLYYYPNEYTYSRDYLTKTSSGISVSLNDRITQIIVDSGQAVSKRELLQKMSGISEVMLFNTIINSSNLIQWEYNKYSCKEIITVSDEEKYNFRLTLDSILEDNEGYCSENMLFERMCSEMSAFIKKNYIMNAQNIFYTASLLFSDLFEFRRPHISQKGRFKTLSVKDISLSLLKAETELNIDEYVQMSKKLLWSHVTSDLVFSEIEQEFVRLDAVRYVRKNCFNIALQDKTYIKDLIDNIAEGQWYCPLQKFSSLEECTPSGYAANEFSVASFVKNYSFDWKIITPKATDRRYQRGILVRNNIKTISYPELVAKVLIENNIDVISEGTLSAFLQIHQLANKVIPKELLTSDNFIKNGEEYRVVL